MSEVTDILSRALIVTFLGRQVFHYLKLDNNK